MVCSCDMPHALVSSSIFKTGGNIIASLLFVSLFHYLSHRLFLHVLASAECYSSKNEDIVIPSLQFCYSSTTIL